MPGVTGGQDQAWSRALTQDGDKWKGESQSMYGGEYTPRAPRRTGQPPAGHLTSLGLSEHMSAEQKGEGDRLLSRDGK